METTRNQYYSDTMIYRWLFVLCDHRLEFIEIHSLAIFLFATTSQVCVFLCIFQGSTVEMETVVMAAYPTEGNPLESEGVRVCLSVNYIWLSL